MSRWFLPNPASVAPNVLAAQVTPPGVGTLLQPSILAERLREFFFPDDEPPTFFTCTREGLLQMAVEWFSDRSIMMIVNGPMSQEWYDIADDCRGNVAIFDAGYGTEIDLNAFSIALRKEKFDILMYVVTDVFIGSRMNTETLSTTFREVCPDGLIVADISGSIFCGMDPVDAKFSDILLCGSEMAMGLPPGLGMTVLNERAHTRLLAHNVMNGRYFNYPRASVSRSPSALDAPPWPLMNALNEQIDSVLTEGMENRVQRLFEVRNLLYEWLVARGFPTLTQPAVRALNCTAIELPTGISPAEMADFTARYGVFITPGVGMMSDKSLILYHGNDTRPEDIAVLTRVMDRFLNDYDTRRRQNARIRQAPQEQKV